MALDGRMKLLLLQCTTVLLCTGVWALPAPLNLTVSSLDFRHTLRWTAAPGSPPNLTYHVFAQNNKKAKEVATSRTLWAEVRLREIHDTYTLYVQSSWNNSYSPPSKKVHFTPDMDTVITAPNVTLSGCGKCIQLNISMPKVRGRSGHRDMTKIYNLSYNVSWRGRLELKATAYIRTPNQTVIIPHLFPGTEYCVQVKPYYLKTTFLPSLWKCVFTSTVPPSQVLAVVGSVAGLVVLSLSAVVLVSFALHYTGIICKLKEALPHALSTGVWQRSLLRLDRTVPEPVSLLPGTGKRQHTDWDLDEDEEDQGTQQVRPTEAQEEDQYMNRCVDLSSDYSSRSGNMTSSCQSAATVSDHPGSQDERIEGNKEEQAQSMNIEDCVEKEESRDCKDMDNWQKLENFESVDLFSVTIAALDVQSDQPLQHTPYESDQGQRDVLPLLHSPYESNQGQCDVQLVRHTPYESNQGQCDVQLVRHTPYESNQGQCDVHLVRHTPYESNQGQCDVHLVRHTPYESNQGQCDVQLVRHTPYESNQGQCDVQLVRHTPYESNQGQCDVQLVRHTPYESNQGQCDVQLVRHTPYESNQGQFDVQPLRHTPYESDQGQRDVQPLLHT